MQKMNTCLCNFSEFRNTYTKPSGLQAAGDQYTAASAWFSSKSSRIELCDIAVSQFPRLFLSPSKNKEINNISSVCLLHFGTQSLQNLLSMLALTAEEG